MKVSQKQKKMLGIIEVFDRICNENNIWYTLAKGSVLGAIRHEGFIPWDTDIDVYVKVTDISIIREKLTEKIPDTMKLYKWDKEKSYTANFDRLTLTDAFHGGLSLDIFPLVGAPANERKQKRFTQKCFYSYKILRTKHVNTKYSKPENVKKIKALKIVTKLIPDILIKKWYYHLQNKYDFTESKNVYLLASRYGIKEVLPKELIFKTQRKKFEHLYLPVPSDYDNYLTKLYGEYMIPIEGI